MPTKEDKRPWGERFYSIQGAKSYSDYTCERFCCGGDYCDGDHLGFIKSFIRSIEDEAERRILEKVISRLPHKGVTIGGGSDWIDGFNECLREVIHTIKVLSSPLSNNK